MTCMSVRRFKCERKLIKQYRKSVAAEVSEASVPQISRDSGVQILVDGGVGSA